MKLLISNLKFLIAKLLFPIVKRLNRLTKSNKLKIFEKKIRFKILASTDIYQWRVEMARDMGVKIGENCRLYTLEFSNEPYLIKIGNDVVIASGTQFITHDGGAWIFYNWDDHSNDINIFGKITIGSNCFIGINCIILPGTVIGDNCIIGAGSVVRGKIPADSVVTGNPAKVIMKSSLYKKMISYSKNAIKVNFWDLKKRHRLVREKFCVNDKDSEENIPSN
ncbi:MAG: acyltransferase [Candidatus Krumholzibacteriota bacterium]|nr:acyltransferase [Candidatus Krumholzibacteriota bacterium]